MAVATDLKFEQRRVRFGALPALAITLAAFSLAASLRDESGVYPDAMSLAVYAMLAPALCVVASIANVANRRYFSAIDIGAATTSDQSSQVVVASAILTNTLEQAFLAVVLYAALAVLLPSPGLLLAALATMFVVGRLCFALGYTAGAGGRAFGFGLTFYPNVMGLIFATGLAVFAII
jgi:MAPEG family